MKCTHEQETNNNHTWFNFRFLPGNCCDMELCVRFFFSVFVVVTIHLVGSGKSASVSCRNIDYGLINRNERKTSGLFERLIMIVCVYVETHKKPNLNRYFFTSLLKLGLVFFRFSTVCATLFSVFASVISIRFRITLTQNG